LKLATEAKALAAALKLAFSAGGVLLRVGDVATLTGAGPEATVVVKIEGDRIAPGAAVLPKESLAIVEAAPAGPLTVEVQTINGQRGVVITASDEGQHALPWADPKAFPLPVEADGEAFVIDAGLLHTAIDRVILAAAGEDREDQGIVLRCVCWGVRGGRLTLVASDGKRLAVAPVGPAEVPDGQYLVPPLPMRLIQKLAGDVRVTLTDNVIVAASDTVAVYGPLAHGRFLSWETVVPKANGLSVARLDLGEFAAAVKRAALVNDQEAKRVVCEFGPDGIGLRAQGKDRGKSKIPGRLDSYAGPPVRLEIAPEYVTDLGRIGPADLHLYGPLRPVVFRAKGGYECLVVPMDPAED
jgi:DNA polymerase III sliding clamp (beta) subunit (PCNA family)